MQSLRQGSIPLFRFRGIQVYLHWSWFLIALYRVQSRGGSYSSILWNALEFLSLFLIVLTHEFGHALACRQVGGTADRILLWPFGGVAYVDPPQRPGATLWSIAAGPLVNVVLAPLLFAAVKASELAGWAQTMPDANQFLWTVFYINAGLLLFNILPIYPLDGGQILRSLLWFVLGRARSLMVATVVGFLGLAGFIVAAVIYRRYWLGLISIYLLLICWGGLQHARHLLRLAKLPRRTGFACPSCRTAPPVGPFWKCGKCLQGFDTFETSAVCPHCSTAYSNTRCLDCGRSHPLSQWVVSQYAGVGTVNGSSPG